MTTTEQMDVSQALWWAPMQVDATPPVPESTPAPVEAPKTPIQPNEPVQRFGVVAPEQINQEPQKPIANPNLSNEQPPVESPEKPTEEKPVEAPVTKEEEKQITEELKEKTEQKKEDIKDDIKNKDEEYINTVLENLLEDNTKTEYRALKAEKESAFYKEKLEEMSKELNNIKYDERKMVVAEEHKPLLKLLAEKESNPDDKEIEYRLITRLYDIISWMTKIDYRPDIQNYYSKQRQIISQLSQGSAWVTPITPQPTSYRPQWVVREPNKVWRRF